MANPRDTVAFDGIAGVYATFEIDDDTITYSATEENGSAVIGRAVTLSAAGTVALAADAEDVIGKLVKVEADDKATVQTGGYMELPGGDGATLTLGTKIVGDLGAASAKGYIRSAASGAAAELLVGRGFIVDATTTTAVVVCL
jgi:hypothetical protein